MTGVVTWSSGGGDVVCGDICSFELIIFCPIYISFFVEHETFGVFCFLSSHFFILKKFSFMRLLTSGVWEAVGEAAVSVTGGYFDSSSTSAFF